MHGPELPCILTHQQTSAWCVGLSRVCWPVASVTRHLSGSIRHLSFSCLQTAAQKPQKCTVVKWQQSSTSTCLAWKGPADSTQTCTDICIYNRKPCMKTWHGKTHTVLTDLFGHLKKFNCYIYTYCVMSRAGDEASTIAQQYNLD